jgi:hypothetical protein
MVDLHGADDLVTGLKDTEAPLNKIKKNDTKCNLQMGRSQTRMLGTLVEESDAASMFECNRQSSDSGQAMHIIAVFFRTIL